MLSISHEAYNLTNESQSYERPRENKKIRIFSRYFPYVPRLFPWWYCGAPSLRFYPPLSYLTATFISWMFQTSAVEAYQYTDFFAFFLAGLSIYLKAIGNSRFSSLVSAGLYMLRHFINYSINTAAYLKTRMYDSY